MSSPTARTHRGPLHIVREKTEFVLGTFLFLYVVSNAFCTATFEPEEHQFFLIFNFFCFCLIRLFYFGWSTDNSELLNLFSFFSGFFFVC